MANAGDRSVHQEVSPRTQRHPPMAQRRDIEFKTSDGVTLRGWFFPATLGEEKKAPCVVMAHGWSATKEFDLDAFAEKFQSGGLNSLVFDHRGFGDSDNATGMPRQEINPALQLADYQDAITHAQLLDGVDGSKIAAWGSSYSGGHVLQLSAMDRRVKATVCQVPFVSGFGNFHRLVRNDFIPSLLSAFEADRHARASGQEPGYLPVVDKDPLAVSSLPTADSWEFFSKVGLEGKAKRTWKNTVTMRSMELFTQYEPGRFVDMISPTPLLMCIAEQDVLTPTDLSLEVYQRAREPKQLHLLRGAGHFDGYTGKWFEENSGIQVAFLKKWLGNQ